MSPPSDLYISTGQTSFLGGPTLVCNPAYLTHINTNEQLFDLLVKNFSRMQEDPGNSMRFGMKIHDDNIGMAVFNDDGDFRNIVTETTIDLVHKAPTTTTADLSAAVEALREEFLRSFRRPSVMVPAEAIRDAITAGLPFEHEVTNSVSLNGVTMEATVCVKAYKIQFFTRASPIA